MLNVIFYQFAKKINSTARPGTGGLSYSCELKQGTSLMNPVLLLHYADMSDNHHSYNYCYVEDFGRYYWVTDRVWMNGNWEVHLKADPLATYRAEILASQQYIVRAYHTTEGEIAADYTVPDDAYTTTVNIEEDSVTASQPWDVAAPTLSGGWFVMGVVSRSEAWNYGPVKYFVLNAEQMRQFNAHLVSYENWTDGDYSDVEKALSALCRIQQNIPKYIVSCRWYPVKPPVVGGGEGEIFPEFAVGGWRYQIPHYALSSATGYATISRQLILPKHPNGRPLSENFRGLFYNSAPWTSYTFEFRPFGMISLDPSRYLESDSLFVTIKIDFISGIASCILSPTAGADKAETVLRSKIGVEIPIVLTGRDVSGIVSGALSAASGSFSGLTEAFNAASYETVEIRNGEATIADFHEPIRLTAHFVKPKKRGALRLGFPLCKLDTIGNYSGFLQCQNAELSLNSTEEEHAAVVANLEGGLYIE